MKDVRGVPTDNMKVLQTVSQYTLSLNTIPFCHSGILLYLLHLLVVSVYSAGFKST